MRDLLWPWVLYMIVYGFWNREELWDSNNILDSIVAVIGSSLRALVDLAASFF